MRYHLMLYVYLCTVGLFGGFIPFTRKLILSDMEAEIGKKALDQCIFSMVYCPSLHFSYIRTARAYHAP